MSISFAQQPPQRNTDVAQRASLEAQPGRLIVLRAADIAQLVFSRLLERSTRVLSKSASTENILNMEVFQTTNRELSHAR